jgi:hypothetical protein
VKYKEKDWKQRGKKRKKGRYMEARRNINFNKLQTGGN